jgi:hypothetical protein
LDVERKWKESVSAICWSRAYHWSGFVPGVKKLAWLM